MKRQSWRQNLPGRKRALIVTLLCIILFWITAAVTLDRVFARRNPDIALFARQASADAQVRRAEALLDEQLTVSGDRAQTFAIGALMREPVNAAAARTLGLVASARGRDVQAKAAMGYANMLSRRDLLTHLWFIETSVAKADIQGALVHYNQALTTSNRAGDILLPILAAAASDQSIAVPLARRLAQRPRWGRLFMRQFIPVASSADALYRLAGSVGLADRPSLDSGLLQDAERRLVTIGGYRQAGQLYARAHASADPSRQTLRNGDFEAPGGGAPFDWNLRDEPDLAAMRMPGAQPQHGSALFITANNGRGGDVASQMMLLAPGRYLLTALIGGIEGDPLSYPQVIVRCERTNAEFLHTRLPKAPDAGLRWQAEFDVPAACPAQWLVIQAASPLDSQQNQPWIDVVSVQAGAVK